MASREELLHSIQPGMKLDRDFFLKVYGYEISFPGFRETAIQTLEAAGCTKARQYYEAAVSEYEQRQAAELKEVAHWYVKECEKEWKKLLKEGAK